jgi:hypothetical protein
VKYAAVGRLEWRQPGKSKRMGHIEYRIYFIDRHADAHECDTFDRIAEAREYFLDLCDGISLPIDLANQAEDDSVGFVLEKVTAYTENVLMWYGDSSLMGMWAQPSEAFYDPLKQLLRKARKSRVKLGVVPVKDKP